MASFFVFSQVTSLLRMSPVNPRYLLAKVGPSSRIRYIVASGKTVHYCLGGGIMMMDREPVSL
jgi:hypothetical protein